MTRYVEYIRVSTDDQVSSGTPQNQRNALRKLAEKRDGEHAGTFEDLNVSGTIQLVNRPGWQRLLRQLQPGDEIRCFDVTRLTRAEGLDDAAHVHGLVRDRGVVLVTCLDGVIPLNTPRDVINWVSETQGSVKERLRMRARFDEGKLTKLEKGEPGAGCRPTGILYARPGGWGLCPDWTKIIQQMFKLCASGTPLQAICDVMKAEGRKSPKGKPWLPSTVGQILRNPAYRGELVQRQGGRTFTLQVPAMVDEALWHAAQAGLSARLNIPIRRAPGKVPALCRHLAFCGGCGRRLRTNAITPDTKYFCPTCRAHHHAGAVDDALWRIVCRALRDANWLLHAALPDVTDGDDEAANVRDRAEKEIVRIGRERAGLTGIWAAGRMPGADYYPALAALREQEDAEGANLQRARRALAAAARARSERVTITERIAALRGRIEGADYATRRELIRAVVPDGMGRIVLFRGGRIEVHGVLPVEFENAKPSLNPWIQTFTLSRCPSTSDCSPRAEVTAARSSSWRSCSPKWTPAACSTSSATPRWPATRRWSWS